MTRDGLAGRTALVTGGGRGIGRAICRRLAAAGVKTAINYVSDVEAAAAVKTEIERGGGDACTVQADVSQPDQVAAAVAAAEAALGPIDLLVCNAGISRRDEPMSPSYEHWRQVMAVNLDGVFLPVMAVKDGMIARGDGRIVCIASIAGLRPRARNVAYATSKAAAIAFVRNISGVIAPQVRINVVAPGLIDTEMITDMDPLLKQRLIDETPIRRLGRPEEIAEMTWFLLSDHSSFTTGQTVVASGGRVIIP